MTKSQLLALKRFAIALCSTALLTSGSHGQSSNSLPQLSEGPIKVNEGGLFGSRKERKEYPTLGRIIRNDPEMDQLISSSAQIEKLAGGFEWAEGPVWVPRNGGYLLFSDVPNNIVYKWVEGVGTREFLFPSGNTGAERGGEPGSNGLTLDKHGRLVLCQHGDRQVARLNSDGSSFTPIARYFQYRRFNSPNDLVYKSNGDLYFTDPPYGLLKNNADENKELNFNGVYRVTPKGEVTLLVSDLTFPNGIAFSPDEKTLYVAVSDPKRAVWMAYDVKEDGTLGAGRVFADVTHLVSQQNKGLPDGLKVDKKGNLWATGPGGIFVFSPDGRQLGLINTGEATGNCAFGGDGSTLYITADMYLCRIRTKTKGLGF